MNYSIAEMTSKQAPKLEGAEKAIHLVLTSNKILLPFSEIKNSRVDKATVEVGFNILQNMNIGRIVRSRSTNNKNLICFEKCKIKNQTEELKFFFKKHNVELAKYI
jgi:hypothetical protein